MKLCIATTNLEIYLCFQLRVFFYLCAEQVFEGIAPFTTSLLDGFNVCILFYGQMGIRKTFAMQVIEG